MKITQIHTKITHEVYTEDKWYTRYGPDDWSEVICYDIMSDENSVDPETAKELEELFQVELELERLIKTEV
jgi:hypothetical protein